MSIDGKNIAPVVLITKKGRCLSKMGNFKDFNHSYLFYQGTTFNLFPERYIFSVISIVSLLIKIRRSCQQISIIQLKAGVSQIHFNLS